MARAQRREAAIKAMRDGACERQWLERASDENLAASGLRPGWCQSQDLRRERPPDHADIRKQMHEIAGKRRRFGYRRIGIMLERKGFTMNWNKL